MEPDSVTGGLRVCANQSKFKKNSLINLAYTGLEPQPTSLAWHSRTVRRAGAPPATATRATMMVWPPDPVRTRAAVQPSTGRPSLDDQWVTEKG